MATREDRIRRAGAVGIVSALALLGAGTFALYNSHGGATQAPSTSSALALGSGDSSLAPSVSSSGSGGWVIPPSTPAAQPSTAGPVPGQGTMALDFGENGRASMSVECMWQDTRTVASISPGSTKVTLFGESATATFLEGIQPGYATLVLERQNQARYFSTTDILSASDLKSFYSWTELQLDSSDAQGVPVRPFSGLDITDTVMVGVSVECGWPPAAVPPGPLYSEQEQSRGSASLTIDGATPVTITTSIDCQWTSKKRVVHYTFPVPSELYGERAWLDMNAWTEPRDPVFGIYRQGEVATYTGSGATFEAHGWNAPQGTLEFHNLTPDPESYMAGVPLPSPIDSFIKPLGGNEAARSLSGTIAWDCGAPPSSVPDVEPTYSPEPLPTADATDEAPADEHVWPEVTVAVSGQEGTVAPEVDFCISRMWDPNGGMLGESLQCGEDNASVPKTTAAAKAGSELTFSVPGYKLASPTLKIASVSEVTRWRGGWPDTAVEAKPKSSATGGATFATPAAGDWVAIFVVDGTDSKGYRITASYWVRVTVTE